MYSSNFFFRVQITGCKTSLWELDEGDLGFTKSKGTFLHLSENSPPLPLEKSANMIEQEPVLDQIS